MEETAVEASTELLERSQLNGTNSSDCLSAEEQKTLSIAVASVSLLLAWPVFWPLSSPWHLKDTRSLFIVLPYN